MQSITSINVTPLMDLTFLLLIVFMITAPVLEYAVDVTPPSLNAVPFTRSSTSPAAATSASTK